MDSLTRGSMTRFGNILSYLRKYCVNCSIAGLVYIANQRLHFTERIFWLICVFVSTFGAYTLINEYRINYERNAVSIVYNSLSYNAKVKVPTVSVCNHYYKDIVPQGVEDFVTSVCDINCQYYDYEIEGQLLTFVYPHTYHDSSIRSKCQKIDKCDGCNKCWNMENRLFLEEFAFNCTEVFVECSAGDEVFDCCHYFRELITPYGKCFLLNSFQNNRENGPNWLKKEFQPDVEPVEIKIVASKPFQVSILNYEDIPNLVMPGNSMVFSRKGQKKIFHVYIEKMINDVDVADISAEYRKCRFPSEVLPTSLYKAHSFSACLNDCIRMHQFRLCNCTLQSMVPWANKDNPPCSLNGLYCLENYSMIRPDAKNLLPWVNSDIKCECLPSCTEYEIFSVYESRPITEFGSPNYTAIIGIPTQASENYRRQALRTPLDTVVTIGGILGLFLGASILSGIEIFYYLMLYCCSSFGELRRRRKVQL